MPTTVTIDREGLHKLYMQWVDKVVEECDWKTSFEPQEIVNELCSILENNPQLYSFQVKL